MKNLVVGITLAILAVPAFAEDRPALKDAKDKVSYSIGLDIGMTFQKQKMEINSDVLAAGLKDGLSGAKPLLSPEEVRQVMTQFSKDMREKTAAANKEAADKNTKEGEKFLAENKAKPGAQYQLFIPSNLGYGPGGTGGDIGPNATLIFEVELLSVKPGEASAPSPAATPPTAASPKKSP